MPPNDIPEIYNLEVKDHAIRRYRDRCGNSMINDLACAGRLRNVIQNGVEYVIEDPVKAVKQLLDHNFQDARYFKEGKIMVVVSGRAIVTCHRAEDSKWVEKTKNEKR